jgi:hypothetical protein
VVPHAATVKVPAPIECAKSPCEPYGNDHSLNLLALFHTQVSVFAGDTEPGCPAAIMTETGQAADSSPPPFA